LNLEPLAPMILHLIPRLKEQLDNIDNPLHNPTPARNIRVELEPGFTIHSAGAFEINETIELYTTGWECEAISSVKGGLLGAWEGAAPNFETIPKTLLFRSVVDINTGTYIYIYVLTEIT
jgi:hypothetical protein